MWLTAVMRLIGIAALLFMQCNLRPLDSDLSALQYIFAARQLDNYFFYREKLPADLNDFDTPEALYEAVDERWTAYYNHQYTQIFLSYLTTQRFGVGIRTDSIAAGYLIREVFPNSPGERAGLRALDTIIRVDNSAVVGASWSVVNAELQGDSGSTVVLRVKRPSDQVNVVVTRGEYTSPSVFVDSVDSAIAHITVTGFFTKTNIPGGTAREFANALAKTTWAAATILDLRQNGGGEVEQCMGVISELLPVGTPAITMHERMYDQTGDSSWFETHIDTSVGPGSGAYRRLYLLVDSNTASASEMVVAALRGRDAVTIVGDTTFGKGRGQVICQGPGEVLACITCLTILPVGTGAASYDEVGIVPDRVTSAREALDVAMGMFEGMAAKRRQVPPGRENRFGDVPRGRWMPLAVQWRRE